MYAMSISTPTGRMASRLVGRVRTALPDLQLAVERLFGEGDRVMMHLRGTGTHRGPLYGAPASGTALRFTVTGVVRLAEDKIAERWFNSDSISIVRQLGLAPSGAAADSRLG